MIQKNGNLLPELPAPAERISSCCSAQVRVSSGGEGTSYYVCTKCNEACDVYNALLSSATPAPQPEAQERDDNGRQDWHFPDDLLEFAWLIIANANGGNWNKAELEWRQAAERWRGEYYKTLAQSPTQPAPLAHQQYTDSNHVSQSADSDIPKPVAQDGAQVKGLDDEVCRIFSRNNLNPLSTLGAPGVAAALVEISDLLATATREAYERGQRDEHDVTYKMLSAAYASGRISQEALSYLHYLGEARLDQLKKKRLAERGNGEVGK